MRACPPPASLWPSCQPFHSAFSNTCKMNSEINEPAVDFRTRFNSVGEGQGTRLGTSMRLFDQVRQIRSAGTDPSDQIIQARVRGSITHEEYDISHPPPVPN